MTTIEHAPGATPMLATAQADLTRAYFAVRKTYAEALTRATCDAQQRECRDRMTQLQRHWDLLDLHDTAAVLGALAAVHAEQHTVDMYVATQIAATQQRPW